MAQLTRYRCSGCGNLTRFDVESHRHTREFVHFSLGGDSTVEEVETLSEEVIRVTCRWCGRADAIEEMPRVEAGE